MEKFSDSKYCFIRKWGNCDAAYGDDDDDNSISIGIEFIANENGVRTLDVLFYFIFSHEYQSLCAEYQSIYGF